MEEFRSVPEEVQKLLGEIEATKDTLKGVSARLASIEKHVRRAFQVPRPTKKAAGSTRTASNLSREQLLGRFDELRSRLDADASVDDDAVFSSWNDDDLRALANELGAANTKKLSIPKTRAFVLQKVRESVMLGTNSLRGIQHGAMEQVEPREESAGE
jgi:hypothetical protein